MRIRRLGQWANLLLGSVLMLAVWVLLVWVGSRPALKGLVDMSPQQRGTIDPVTIELLSELADQQVRVEFHTFFSLLGAQPQNTEQLQRQRILARLRELTSTLLRQYAFHGNDVVRVFEHDMYGDITGTREAMARFGGVDQMDDIVVVSVQQPGREPRNRKLSLEGDLAVVDLPELRVDSPVPQARIPVLKDYKGEEALSSALKSLLVQGVPRIYFLHSNSHAVELRSTNGAGYSQLWQALTDMGFEPRMLDLTANAGIPQDASLVAVIEPRREFASTEARALFEYLQRGGRAFVNYSYSFTPGWNPTGGELGQLLGYEVLDEIVFHPLRTLHGPGVGGDPRVRKLDLIVNPHHPITRRIDVNNQLLQFADARPLREAPAAEGVRRDALLQTGLEAWLGLRKANGFDYTPPPPNRRQSYTVGMVMEVDGEAPPGGGERPTGICVVTSGVFCNNLGMPINGALATNVFNFLAERKVLLDIKGSRYEARHLQLVPDQLHRVWWFLVVGVPGTLLASGLFVFWRRRQL